MPPTGRPPVVPFPPALAPAPPRAVSYAAAHAVTPAPHPLFAQPGYAPAVPSPGYCELATPTGAYAAAAVPSQYPADRGEMVWPPRGRVHPLASWPPALAYAAAVPPTPFLGSGLPLCPISTAPPQPAAGAFASSNAGAAAWGDETIPTPEYVRELEQQNIILWSTQKQLSQVLLSEESQRWLKLLQASLLTTLKLHPVQQLTARPADAHYVERDILAETNAWHASRGDAHTAREYLDGVERQNRLLWETHAQLHTLASSADTERWAKKTQTAIATVLKLHRIEKLVVKSDTQQQQQQPEEPQHQQQWQQQQHEPQQQQQWQQSQPQQQQWQQPEADLQWQAPHHSNQQHSSDPHPYGGEQTYDDQQQQQEQYDQPYHGEQQGETGDYDGHGQQDPYHTDADANFRPHYQQQGQQSQQSDASGHAQHPAQDEQAWLTNKLAHASLHGAPAPSASAQAHPAAHPAVAPLPEVASRRRRGADASSAATTAPAASLAAATAAPAPSAAAPIAVHVHDDDAPPSFTSHHPAAATAAPAAHSHVPDVYEYGDDGGHHDHSATPAQAHGGGSQPPSQAHQQVGRSQQHSPNKTQQAPQAAPMDMLAPLRQSRDATGARPVGAHSLTSPSAARNPTGDAATAGRMQIVAPAGGARRRAAGGATAAAIMRQLAAQTAAKPS